VLSQRARRANWSINAPDPAIQPGGPLFQVFDEGGAGKKGPGQAYWIFSARQASQRPFSFRYDPTRQIAVSFNDTKAIAAFVKLRTPHLMRIGIESRGSSRERSTSCSGFQVEAAQFGVSEFPFLKRGSD
jgi:hypothetical protein